MRLRTALKIIKAFDVETGTSRHTQDQLRRANNRHDRLATTKETDHSWDAMMRYFGAAQRAKMLAKGGASALGFALLMRTPVDQWAGDPAAWPFRETAE